VRDGELPNPKLSLVLGHEIVGSVVEGGERFGTRSPVGVP
jgi:D-arabinose 1-dehydrogenase-like Zn-dependent alcohol dehydrogenase